MSQSQPQVPQRASMASRFTNSPVITRLRNSPVISAAKRWAAGKASPKPQPRDPNPRRYSSSSSAPQSFIEKNNVGVNGNIPPTNKVAKFARNASPRLKKMGEGFLEAAKGGWSSVQNPNFQQHYATFLKSMGIILLAMYAVLGVILLVYFPLVAFLFTWAPGLLGQLLTMMPLWAYVITRKRTPMSANQLFLDELENLSSSRTQELSQQMKQEDIINKNWMEDVYHDLRTSWHFTKYSLMFLSFSIIPVVGSFITYLGQMWLVADRMGWNLLSVYTISSKKNEL